MKITQIRNACLLLEVGQHKILVDPMLADKGSLPGFKIFDFSGGRKPNPLVDLPPNAQGLLESATCALVTHEHPDHIDPKGAEFCRNKGLTVYCPSIDVAHMHSSKGLNAEALKDGSLGMEVEVIPGSHGPPGPVGWAMGPVHGVYLACPNEPSIYITGDTVLVPSVSEAIERLKPDIIVAPAGSANFGAGPCILFTPDEVVALVKAAPKVVVLNHMEALDHCGTTREMIKERLSQEGLLDKVKIPADGEALTFDSSFASADKPRVKPVSTETGSWQKTITSVIV